MLKISALLIILLSISAFAYIQSDVQTNVSTVDTEVKKDGFNAYWYAGKAELNSYSLNQARYGENHKGDATLIFVTEDFSKSTQVKMDYPNRNPSDKVPIMKLNFTKKFLTGIYPYSMMTSVFTPVSRDKFPNTLKTTTTSQEWCGHTFSQLNLKEEQYNLKEFSYFESEGDKTRNLDKVTLEDELWTIARLNPSDLPTGNQSIIPTVMSSRLTHQPLKVQQATLQLTTKTTKNYGKSPVFEYEIAFKDLDRTVKIYIEKAFPYKILGWEETYQSFAGKSTTTATLKKSIQMDYWNKHSNADRKLRKLLE